MYSPERLVQKARGPCRNEEVSQTTPRTQTAPQTGSLEAHDALLLPWTYYLFETLELEVYFQFRAKVLAFDQGLNLPDILMLTSQQHTSKRREREASKM